jgi:hypothetical protein
MRAPILAGSDSSWERGQNARVPRDISPTLSNESVFPLERGNHSVSQIIPLPLEGDRFLGGRS